MNTLNQLLRAVITNPEADDPRLQFADVLQESGEEQWAGFIREQVRRGAHERGDGYSRTPKSVELELWTGLLHKFNLPSNWLVSFRIDDPVDRGGVHCVCIHRGFVVRLNCTTAEFLQHADELIWHPEQKVRCGSCGGNYANWKCTDCDRGRVSRPCPDTAQPITKVVLTTDPRDIQGWDEGQFRSVLRAKDGRQIWRCDQWPGVEFEFPEILDWVAF